jgi:hypothetical protein
VSESEFHLEVVRSGGVAGITRRVVVHSGELTSDEKASIQEVVKGSPRPAMDPPPTGADRFQYDLTVTIAERSETVTVYDGAMDPQLRTLIRRLL